MYNWNYLPIKALLFITLMIVICGSTEAKMLKGNINHNEQIYQNNDLTKQVINNSIVENHWYKIPQWMAGVWQRSEETQLCSYDNSQKAVSTRNHKVKVKDLIRYGTIQDKNGDIWQSVQIPQFAAKTELPDAYAQYQEIACKFVTLSDGSVVKSSFGRETRISKFKKGRIENWNQESTVTITPVSQKEIILSGLLKSFDSDMNLIDVTCSYTILKRISSFTPISSKLHDGNDLSKSFHNFLLSQGREDLVPDKQMIAIDDK